VKSNIRHFSTTAITLLSSKFIEPPEQKGHHERLGGTGREVSQAIPGLHSVKDAWTASRDTFYLQAQGVALPLYLQYKRKKAKAIPPGDTHTFLIPPWFSLIVSRRSMQYLKRPFSRYVFVSMFATVIQTQHGQLTRISLLA
jgi:hypothetical protein